MSTLQTRSYDDQSWRLIHEVDSQLVAAVTAQVVRWLRAELELERERQPRAGAPAGRPTPTRQR
jgi:hypothetical protein